MSKKNFLVVTTGGTIGCALSGGTISLDAKAGEGLIASLAGETEKASRFDRIEPFSLLSENMTLEKQVELADLIRSKSARYDGILVTHGSDTLPFTAAALGYLLSGTRVPVALIASDRVLTEKGANGQANFTAAVSFFSSGKREGVFVPWKNRGERDTKIYAGTRMMPFAFADARASSPGGPVAGVSREGEVRLFRGIEKADEAAKIVLPRSPVFPKVLFLPAFPDMGEAVSFPEKEKPAAVLLSPYHSSTLPTGVPSFRAFCGAARDAGVPVYAVCENRGAIYDSSLEFGKLSIVPLRGMSPAAALVKLRLLLCCGREGDLPRRIAGDIP